MSPPRRDMDLWVTVCYELSCGGNRIAIPMASRLNNQYACKSNRSAITKDCVSQLYIITVNKIALVSGVKIWTLIIMGDVLLIVHFCKVLGSSYSKQIRMSSEHPHAKTVTFTVSVKGSWVSGPWCCYIWGYSHFLIPCKKEYLTLWPNAMLIPLSIASRLRSVSLPVV